MLNAPLHALAALALTFGATAASAEILSAQDRAKIERRLEATKNLIENSPSSRAVDASRLADGQHHRTRARELHGQAAAALNAGELERAAKLLDHASRAMFMAVQMSKLANVASPAGPVLEERLRAAQTLLDAYLRAATERSEGSAAARFAHRMQTLLADAAAHHGAGRSAEAMRTVDVAYLAVSQAVAELRGGETVVHTLNFATKADEYDYEVNRYEAHRMLVAMLVKDRDDDALRARVNAALAEAARLRQYAAALAAWGKHDEAVKSMEGSTGKLIAAIRAAGVFIPG